MSDAIALGIFDFIPRIPPWVWIALVILYASESVCSTIRRGTAEICAHLENIEDQTAMVAEEVSA